MLLKKTETVHWLPSLRLPLVCYFCNLQKMCEVQRLLFSQVQIANIFIQPMRVPGRLPEGSTAAYFKAIWRIFSKSFFSSASKYSFWSVSCSWSGKKSRTIIFSTCWKICKQIIFFCFPTNGIKQQTKDNQ